MTTSKKHAKFLRRLHEWREAYAVHEALYEEVWEDADNLLSAVVGVKEGDIIKGPNGEDVLVRELTVMGRGVHHSYGGNVIARCSRRLKRGGGSTNDVWHGGVYVVIPLPPLPVQEVAGRNK